MNCYWLTKYLIHEHVICEGFKQGYNDWFCHGEGTSTSKTNVCMEEHVEQEQCDNIDAMLCDGLGFHQFDDLEDEWKRDECDEDAENFYKLANYACQDLYPRCSMSKL